MHYHALTQLLEQGKFPTVADESRTKINFATAHASNVSELRAVDEK